jgi:C1A family cysteine protease
MLMVGYTGNFYIIKNSWGTDWGDNGYCYVPKKVLEASDPELIAVLVKKDEEPPK